MEQNQRLVLYFEALQDGAFALKLGETHVLRFSSDGLQAQLGDVVGTQLDRDDIVRWGAPAALAPQGIACLHGSAVLTDFGLIAVLGNGGAGKSTLARLLGGRGWAAVADDVLLCDEAGHVDLAAEPALRAWVLPASDSDTVRYGDLMTYLCSIPRDWQRVGLVVILGDRVLPHMEDADMSSSAHAAAEDEGSDTESFFVEPIVPLEAVSAVALHRFGGHPAQAAWGPQLRAIAALADRVPVVRLREPEGLDALNAALPAIMQRLREIMDAFQHEAPEVR